MRRAVLAAAALAFAAGLVLNPAGVVRMARFCAAGGFGVPGRAVLLGLGGVVAAAVLAAMLRRRAARRTVAAGRPPRLRPGRPSLGKPAAAAPRPKRAAARPAKQTRRKA